MRSFAFLLLLPLSAVSQQIWDVWETTWDRSSLFERITTNPSPINFGTPSSIGQADIVVTDSQKLQTMHGFGASLTDSSATLLSQLKSKNSDNYNSLLHRLFDPTEGANSAAIAYLRIPIGASDFSAKEYSLDDSSGDTSFSKFNINNQPSNVFSVLTDIVAIAPHIKIHICPWSPPAWMKDSNTMNGGSLKSQYVSVYANYLLKALQAYKNKGFNIFAISIQNEPLNENDSYPTAKFSVSQEVQIGKALRTLMNNNGFSSTLLTAYEHNWDDAGTFPLQVFQQAGSTFQGATFHCYAGQVSDMDTFHKAFPDARIEITECSGVIGSDWWSDIKWYMDNLFIGGPEHNSRSALMWNLALNSQGQPILPDTTSCGGGCRGVVQINSGGSFSVNQEYYAIAHAGKAINPRDLGGPIGQRIGVTVGGTLNWALRVMAYETQRANAADWNRYSLTVLNWDDHPNGPWDPTPVQTTIEFRGQQARYTFPVGVTTLWWYAPKQSLQAHNTTFYDDEAGQRAFTFENVV